MKSVARLRGYICPRAHAPCWGRQIEVGILIITKCQMSADANVYDLQNFE